MIILQKKWFHTLIFFLTSILVTHLSISGNWLSYIVNGQDITQPFNAFKFFIESFYIWFDLFPGSINSGITAYVFYGGIIAFFNQFFDNIFLSINLFWLLLHFLILILYYQLFNIFNKNQYYAFLGSLLLYFNINTINIFQFPTVFVDYASYIGIPLFIISTYKFIIEKQKKYILFFLLAQFILFRPTSIFILINLLLLLFIGYNCIKKNIGYAKKAILLGFLSIGFLGYAIYAFYLSSKQFLNNNNFNAYTSSSYNAIYQKGYQLTYIMRNNACATCHENSDYEFPNLVYLKYNKLYNTNTFFIFISFSSLLVIIFALIYIRENRIRISIGAILGMWFIGKGVNPPFSLLSEQLINIPLINIFFRSGPKYFMFFIIPVLIIVWLYIAKKNKIFIYLAWLYILGHASLIFIIHKPINTYRSSSIPSDYFKVINELKNKVSSSDKILVLPIANIRLDGQAYYKDGYAGTDRLYALSNRNFIFGMSLFFGNKGYNSILSKLPSENNINTNGVDIDSISTILGYNYILVEKDRISYPTYNLSESKEYTDEVVKIINKKMRESILETKNFILYKKLFNQNSMLSSTIPSLSFSKINPTKYTLTIRNLTGSQPLSFLQSFHDERKLYPNTAHRKPYTGSDYIFFQGEELSYLRRKNFADDTHHLVHEYANAWEIRSDEILQTLPKGSYKINQDGSIDVDLVLYFRPQSRFYVGIIISLLTMLGLIGWLTWERRKDKKLYTYKTR